jgi:enterochelin esterase-like enzyme
MFGIWSVVLLLSFELGAWSFAAPAAPDPAEGNKTIVWVNEPKSPLPAGMTHHKYFSKSMNHDVGYCIYLPPDYDKDTSKRYPVIYNLHGAGGNELHGQLSAEVLQEGILAKRWPPMIIVMPNGGKYTYYKDSYDGKYMGETTVMKELIPHIDAQYRTIAARHGRCIEGFSMGGRGSTRLAMKYPDMFCSLFNQSGNVYHTADQFNPQEPNKYPNNYLGPDKARYEDNDSFLLLKKNLDQIKGKLRIQVWCGTQDDGHLPSVRDYHQALLQAGVDHTYMEIEGLDHNQTQMINRYRTIWFDYHVESLRRADPAAKPASEGKKKKK